MDKSTFTFMLGYIWGIVTSFLVGVGWYWKIKDEHQKEIEELTKPRPLDDPDVSDEDVDGLPD